jgi:glycerophosphoryl diester phosphodiesterase
MRRLLDAGVDGLVSDRPDICGRILHERCGRPQSTRRT